MRKKYLSALLFGALLVTSAGTFTSCKDYDDDINNLQEQITANADAIKKLQEMIGDGKFVTNIASEDNGLKITWNDGNSTVIENVINGEAQNGDVVTINPETGEIIINDEGTGFFASKGEGETPEFKVPYVNESGVLVLINEKGEEVVTGIRVSPVTAVVNPDGSAILTIIAADGTTQTVKIPSAASIMSDLVLAGWIEAGDIDASGNLSTENINSAFEESNTGLLNIDYCWLETIRKANYDNNEETTWSAQKDVVKNQVLTSLRGKGIQLVTRVSPADLDLSTLKFTLQDSKGNTLPIVLNPSTNFTGTITRAANSSINMIPLDVTTDTYASAAAYANLYGANDGKTLYSLVETSGARSNYGLTVKAEAATVTQQSVVKVDGKTAVSGKFEVEINKANKLTFGDDPEYVYDYYVEAKDKAVADLFGLTIDKKNGTFTVAKLADQITTTEFTLYVYALHIDGKIYRSEIIIKPSRKMVNEAVLAAGDQVITQSIKADKSVDLANHMRFDISLDAMFTALGTENTAKWTSATLGANTNFSVGTLKINDQETTLPYENANKANYYDIKLLDKDGKELAASDYYKAVTMRVYAKYLNSSDEATLQPGKNYELTINFNNTNTDGVTEVLNTVKMTYTPVLPALSDYMQKHESFWNDDKTVLLGVDNSINETFVSRGKNLNYAIKDGFKKFGSTEIADKMDITFELADNKVNNVAFVDFETGSSIPQTVMYTKGADENANYGKEFTVKVASATYLTGYSYGADELAAQTFKMKVLSPIVEGKIEVKEGTSVEVYASGNAELNIADLIGYNYNKQTYNLYMDVQVDKSDTRKAYEISENYTLADNYADKAIASVKFESGDEQVFKITENMKPVTSSAGTPAKWNKTTKSVDTGIVTLDTSNISQDTQTTIKVTVTDIWGYEKTVEVPLTIKMAK